MKSRFKKALQGIFLTSVASIVSTNGAEASNYELKNIKLDGNNTDTEIGTKKDLSQKFVLKMNSDNSYLIAGHRSHRSHSSHRSSSSGSSYRSSSSSSGSTYRSSSSTSNAVTAPKVYSLGERTISSGVSGEDVRELATLFIKITYITEDELTKDISGNVTCCRKLSAAISKFQRANNLTADGIAGKSTIQILKKQAADYNTSKDRSLAVEDRKVNLGDRVLKKGMKGTDVTHLKNILIDKKLLIGALAKGISLFDEEIEKAVIAFQEELGIDIDGIVDAQTAYFLKK